MKIEENKLIIDEALTDENIEELIVAINQEGIEVIELQNDELSSGIVQALWCSGKKIEVDGFLSKFFDNVKVVS